MTFTAFVVLVAGVWLVCGLSAAVVMGRRGHDPFTWGFLGLVLGPLAVPMIAVAIRNEARIVAVTVPQGRPNQAQGRFDALVGIDGSPQSEAAFATALRLMSGTVGRFAVATVSSFEAATSAEGRRAEAAALARLAVFADRAAETLGRPAETIVLRGNAFEELQRCCLEQHFDVLVIGSRGAGLASALLGSVAKRLAERSRVPVLIVPEPAASAS